MAHPKQVGPLFKDLAFQYQMPVQTLLGRLRAGMQLGEALTKPRQDQSAKAKRAWRAGLKFYTGQPCGRCGCVEKYVSSGNCRHFNRHGRAHLTGLKLGESA